MPGPRLAILWIDLVDVPLLYPPLTSYPLRGVVFLRGESNSERCYSKVAVKRSPSRDPQTMKSTKNTKKVQNLGKSTYMKGTRRPEIVKIYLKLVKNQKYNENQFQIPLKILSPLYNGRAKGGSL